MYQAILLIYVFVAVFIIALVLVQQGKGASMGAAFGSGASQTVFGSRGSGSFLFKITMGLIALFFIISIGLNYMTVQASKQEKVILLPANSTKKSLSLPNLPAQIPTTNTSNTTHNQK